MPGRKRRIDRRSTLAAATIGLIVTGTVGMLPHSAGAAKETVTFTENVAPIIFTHCTSCHRPGEAAPFALMSYQDVRAHGRLIAAVTESRRMPPWKAAPADYALKNERRLTDDDIATLQTWVAAGMPEGDPGRLPPLPVFTDGWQLGKPDLVVKMDRAYPVPASGPDIYRNFVVPLNLPDETWVNAVDFHPSARGVVHHSLFLLDATGAARRRDGRDGLPGYGGAMGIGSVADLAGGRAGLALLLGSSGLGRGPAPEPGRPTVPPGRGSGGGFNTDTVARAVGGLGGWALGAQPQKLPDGLALLVPRGADLILSTHFHPSGKAEEEMSTVGLYFAAGPPTKRFTVIQLPPLFGVFEGIEIPPGERRYTISDSFILPIDVKAFLVGAHAHYLAKEMKLTATFPDGIVKTLLDIPDWDFAWQEQYQFNEFVSLPKGTRLEGTISYDNSAENPRNPSNPPKVVSWGEQSTDEMGSLGLQVVAASEEDLPMLQQAYRQHVRQAMLTRPGLRRLIERLQQQR